MFAHPIYKLGFRELVLKYKGTYFFLAFVACIVVLILAVEGIRLSGEGNIYAEDDALLVVSNAMAPRYPLPVRYVEEIKEEINNIDGVAAFNFVPATLNGERQSVPVIASYPQDMIQTNTDLVVAASRTERWIEDPNSVMIGADLSRILKIKLGDSITLQSKMFAVGGYPVVKLKVRAIYTIKDEIYPSYTLFIHDRLIRPDGQLTTLQGANTVMVQLKSRDDASRVSAAIDKLFSDRAVQTRTFLRDQYIQSFRDQGKGIRGLILAYGYIGICVGLVLLVAFVYYHDHMIQRSCYDAYLIGFSRKKQRFYLTLAQSTVIYSGVLFGGLLALILSVMLETTIKKHLPFFTFPWEYCYLVVGFSLIIIVLITYCLQYLIQIRPDSYSTEGGALI